MCKILKTAGQRVHVRETDENLGLMVLHVCTAYVGYFSCLILSFQFGVIW